MKPDSQDRYSPWRTISSAFKGFAIILAFVPLIIFCSFLIFKLEQSKQDALQVLEQAVGFRQEMLEYWMEEQRDRVRTMAALLPPPDGDPAEISRLLHTFSQYSEQISLIAYVTPDGISYDRTLDISDRDYFQRARLGELIVSNLVVGRLSKAPVVLFSAPVRGAAGEIQGIVLASVKIDTVSRILEKFDYGHTGEILLATRNGRLLAEPRLASQQQRLALAREGGLPALAGDGSFFTQGSTEGYGSFTDYRNGRVFAAYSFVEDSDWVIIAKIDEQEVLAPLWSFATGPGVFLLTALFAWLLLVFLTMRRITGPIARLAVAAEQIGSGDYETVIDETELKNSPQELKILAVAFNRMMETIRGQFEKLAEAEKRKGDIIRSIPDILTRFDQHGNVMEVLNTKGNPLAKTERDGLVGHNMSELLPPDIVELLKGRLRTAIDTDMIIPVNYQINSGGNVRHREAKIVPTGENDALIFVRDVTSQVQMEQRLLYLSYHDSLTGLYNRAFFEEEMYRLNNEWTCCAGIAVCDIDGLKLINDALGHEAGDELLLAAANILSECAGDSTVIARIGGDEFSIIFHPVEEEKVRLFAAAVEAAAARHNGREDAIPVYLSVGYSVCQEPGELRETFRLADNMMYEIKAEKRQQIRKLIEAYIVKRRQEEVSKNRGLSGQNPNV